MREIKGFTLVELLIVLAIVSVVTLFAVPNYEEFSGASLLTASNQAFVADMVLARNIAITRNKRLVMCKQKATVCTTDGGWEQGWLIYVDDGIIGIQDKNDSVVRLTDSLGRNITVRGNTNVRNKIIFRGDGSMAGSNGKLIFCDSRIRNYEADKFKALVLIISNSGRFRTVKGNEDSSFTTCIAG